jgi:hypothetical protein
LTSLKCAVYPPHLLLISISRQDPFYLPVLHVFKYISIVQGCFSLVFHTHTYKSYCNFINSLCYCSFSVILFPYYSTTYSELLYDIFIHRFIVFQYYSLSTILFSSLISP